MMHFQRLVHGDDSDGAYVLQTEWEWQKTLDRYFTRKTVERKPQE